MHRTLYFLLKISYEKFKEAHKNNEYIKTTTTDGIILKIKTERFIKFLNKKGINGNFLIKINNTGKMISLVKL